MNRIDRAFQSAKRRRRSLFVAYIMGGDPSLKATEQLIPQLEEAGVGILELGIPFSDPIADGATIQKASGRALAGGATLEKLIGSVARVRRKSQIPIVLFSYLNPVLQMGVETFARKAAAAGADGALLVDLPPEEAGKIGEALRAEGLKLIFLVAPTTLESRVRRIAKAASGFVYYVSRLGVTGARDRLDADLKNRLKELKKIIKIPVAVGFGISKPEHVKKLSSHCDAIVVGSAIVEKIEKGQNTAAFVRSLTKELNHD